MMFKTLVYLLLTDNGLLTYSAGMPISKMKLLILFKT